MERAGPVFGGSSSAYENRYPPNIKDKDDVVINDDSRINRELSSVESLSGRLVMTTNDPRKPWIVRNYIKAEQSIYLTNVFLDPHAKIKSRRGSVYLNRSMVGAEVKAFGRISFIRVTVRQPGVKVNSFAEDVRGSVTFVAKETLPGADLLVEHSESRRLPAYSEVATSSSTAAAVTGQYGPPPPYTESEDPDGRARAEGTVAVISNESES
ncbi:hypothetical protein [Pantoea sp. B65]|uniref:hypothetical protein n=1 Tax=Pantoea sp. B65 TaxID=2813359 RepID=UPI0039B4BC2C